MKKKYYKTVDNKQVFFEGNILTVEPKDEQGITMSIFNPSEKQMLDAGWLIYEPTDEEKLATAKSEKIKQIENYDASSNVEEFTINGNPMWLGHELRQQIRTSADAYEALGYETMTKVFNGVEFVFSIEQWRQMLAALEVYAAEALNATERHKINVSKMDNIQDVIDYDYTTGYPMKLAFGNVED